MNDPKRQDAIITQVVPSLTIAPPTVTVLVWQVHCLECKRSWRLFVTKGATYSLYTPDHRRRLFLGDLEVCPGANRVGRNEFLGEEERDRRTV